MNQSDPSAAERERQVDLRYERAFRALDAMAREHFHSSDTDCICRVHPTRVNHYVIDPACAASVIVQAADAAAAPAPAPSAEAVLAYLYGQLHWIVRHRWGGDVREFTEGVLYCVAVAERAVAAKEEQDG